MTDAKIQEGDKGTCNFVMSVCDGSRSARIPHAMIALDA